MTTTELATLVDEMRRAQSEYFRTSNNPTWDESKRQEHKVDEA